MTTIADWRAIVRRRTFIFLLFTSAYFLSQFFRSTNAVIAPNLAQDLTLTASQLGLMTSLFFAVFALAQIPLGIGLDRWGPRWMTSGTMLAAVAGSLLFAVAQNFGMAAAARALLGLGMAGVLIGGLKTFSQWYPAERFATATGLLTGIGSLGALVAATPLAWMNVAFGWRMVFVAGAFLIALSAASIAIWARNTPPGVTWSSQRQSENQIHRIVRKDIFWRIALLMGIHGGITGAYRTLWAGPYLYDMYVMDEITVGNFLLLMSVGTIVGFIATGWIVDRFGLMWSAVGLGLLLLISLIVLALRPEHAVLAPMYLVFGLTSGLGVVLVGHARRVFPSRWTGQVLSLVNLAAFGGIFLFQWGSGVLIDRFPIDPAGHYSSQAYTTMLAISALAYLAAFLWYLPTTRPTALATQQTEYTGESRRN
jgi:predicted MFS family arabinose efflux permease